uniref:GLOBIN domain-containing protein n=1 Tax=Rhabditophanes sp. KR3021 TaxID=114890 RepID=A0AC35TPC0_9BILA
MIVGTMCPSLFIFGLTLLTNKAVRGSNRSRKLLFQMTDALLERFNSKETMQTAISLMLIVKFLVFRSSLFALDIWELAWIFIYEKDTRFPEAFNYIKDISNFLVTLNSATNCIIFMKAADWIEISMFRKKSTHLRKTPCLLENLTMCTRAYILQNTWQKIRQMTEDDFGSRVLVSMIRLDNKLNGKMIQAINDKKSMMDEGMRGSLESVVVSINSESSAKCSVQTKIVACNSFESNSLMSGYNKISMPLSEIIVSPYFIKMATNISSMMETVIKMMCEGKRETEIKAFIRRIGSIHSHKEVTFSNVAWKAFKTTTIDLVKECVYDSESEKGQALDAWNSFICMIIVEMKLGQWEPGNIL